MTVLWISFATLYALGMLWLAYHPSKIGYLLGIPSKKLEAIIYYERYVVINAGAAAEQGIRCV